MFTNIQSKIRQAGLQIRSFLNDEDGQAAPEYGIILALIAVVIVVAVGALGLKVAGAFQKGANAIP